MNSYEHIAMFSKAMSDSNRVKIVTLIQREESVCVCEMSDTLELAQPLVSRHLKQLRSVGIVESYKEGKWVIYKISNSNNPLLQVYLEVCKESENNLPSLITCAMT